MTVIVTPDEMAVDAPSDDRPMIHLVCDCEPLTALCGAELSGDGAAPDETLDCVVCDDIGASVGCPRCGAT